MLYSRIEMRLNFYEYVSLILLLIFFTDDVTDTLILIFLILSLK